MKKNSTLPSTVFANMTDKIKENLLFSVLILLFLLAGVWYALSYFPSDRETKIEYTPNAKAELNPFYATELLLNEQVNEQVGKHSDLDNDVTTSLNIATTQLNMDLIDLVDNLPSLTMSADGKHPTLIIRSIGESLTDEQKHALIDWMADGGHLIVFSRGGFVPYEDWQPIAKRINKLKSQANSSKKTVDWTADETLNELLAKLEDTGKNDFLRKLGIYQVWADTPNSQLADNQSANHPEDVTVEAGYADEFDNELKPFQLNETKQVKQDAQLSIDTTAVKRNLEYFNYQSLFFTTETATGQLIKLDNSNIKLVTDLMYAQYPQAKRSDRFHSITIGEIREMLTQQLAQANEYIEQQDKMSISDKVDKHWLALNGLEMQKTLQILLKLSDERLLYMFNATDRVFVDSDYGKGRLTVIRNNKIWANPNQQGLEYAQKIQESNPKIPSLFHQEIGNLYAFDNASLLLALTKNSNEIWLFPNVDIDSLPVMLWKKARLAILGLLLLCAMWLWSLYNRFGKRQVLATGSDSDIFRYFQQIGRYGWEYDKAKRLSKVTRLQVESLAKKALVLKPNELLTTTQLTQLSQLLLDRLNERLDEKLDTAPHNNGDSKIDNNSGNNTGNNSGSNNEHQELLSMMRANQAQLQVLLSPEQLKESLLPTANDLDSFTTHGFTQYTQTLWLVKWLLN